MCQALLEIMEPEINKIKETVREETTQQLIKDSAQSLKELGHANEEIKVFLATLYKITSSEAEQYL